MDSLLDPSRFRPDRLPSPAFMPRDDDFVELLRSVDFDVRLQTLNRIISLSKRDPDWFSRFAKKGELFKNLDRILMDDRWEVQHQCIKFLVEAMPTFGSCLEYCICYVMPNLIPKLGSSKITVRRVSVQAIQAFLKTQPGALGSVLKMLVNYLLTSPDRTTKSEVLQEVPTLFIAEIMQSNWFALLDGLTQWLATADKETAEKIAIVAKKLEVYIGNDAFSQLIQNLSENQRKDYNKYSTNVTIVIEEREKQPEQTTARASIKLHSGERRFRFGIVPSFISSMVLDDGDSAARISGLEKLKQIIEKITPEEVARLVPHLHSYLIGLSHVLTDLNFKVVVLALDVVRITVNRLKSHMEAHLQQVISLLSKHFGNQKAVIKQLIMMTCMDLFQNLNPKAVVGVLCVYLENRNSRMREEVVNVLTSALMIISASKINFTAVINVMVPLLMDPKRRVRLAAFEQLSVVAFLMNGKIDPLLRAVRDVELRYKANGLYSAVMARIHRHLLPRIRYDGLIEYSTPPITDSSFNVKDSELHNADNMDLLWILHAGGENHDRPIAPVSVADTIAKSLKDFPKEGDKVKQCEPQDNTKCLISYVPMERMKSDDQIVRRNESKAITNPNSSTNSWHAPAKRNNSIVNEDRSSSAIVNSSNGKLSEPNRILDKRRLNGVNKRTELNNNIPINSNKTSKGTVNILKARSEGNLSDERENNPPINYDDVPIRPAKNGKYLDEYPLSPSQKGSPMVKKSTSHHSLPITSTHVPLKNTQSGPTRKPHSFLKSSSSNKVQPATTHKPVSRETSKTQMNGTAKTGNGTTSNHCSGASVQLALKKIDSEDWNDKVDGIHMIANLSSSNPKQVSDNIHEIVVALLNECKNLRSSVSRVALWCTGVLTQNVKGKMDAELDKLCAILMHKAGDVSNAFIREDAHEALEKVVKYASAGKALNGIISAGSKSKNNTIRASCASFVCNLVSRMGPEAVLNSADQMGKLIPQVIAFCKDANPSVRQHGKQTLLNLSQESCFDRMLKKHTVDADYRSVKEILSEIEKKGGLESLDSTSVSLSGSLSRNGSIKKVVPRKLPDNVQLDLDEIRADLTAAGWERRIGGLKRFDEMCVNSSRAVASDTKLIEAFMARLNDINSKVSLEGMDTYLVILPVMSKLFSTEAHLKAVLNQLILALMSHLSSKSEEHKYLAQTCLQETVKQIESACLSAAIAAATKKANVKQKPFMLNIFNRLNHSLYHSKPKQVEVVALPILWDSIRGGVADPEIKKAVTDFAKGLVKLMGERAIMDHAAMELDPPRRKILESLIR